MMPGMTGLDVLEALRMTRVTATPHLPAYMAPGGSAAAATARPRIGRLQGRCHCF